MSKRNSEMESVPESRANKIVLGAMLLLGALAGGLEARTATSPIGLFETPFSVAVGLAAAVVLYSFVVNPIIGHFTK